MGSFDKLKYGDKYNWVGTFWLPSDPGVKFSGRASYSPETGIRLSLTTFLENTELAKQRYIAHKTLHAILDVENGTTPITFFNVGLSVGFSLGGISTYSLNGHAQTLVMGELLTEINFDRYEIQYNKQFNNIFFWDHENNSISFGKKPAIKLKDSLEVLISANSKGKPIMPDEFENLFWSFDENEYISLMQQIRPLLKDKLLFARRSVEPGVRFSQNNLSILRFFEIEQNWRRLWRLICDGTIYVESSSLAIKMTGLEFEGKYKVAPFLSGHLLSKNQETTDRIYQELPINFSSFKGASFDLSNTTEYVEKWLTLSNDAKWQPVSQGLERILEARTRFIDSSKYVSLISDIETFLDLVGHPNANVDNLIENYASDKWRQGFQELSGKIGETPGKWAQEIRNAITHPKAAGRKANGKYWKIASEVSLLHKIYCHLSGLLIKGILSYPEVLAEAHLEGYCEDFIHRRASFEPITYID